MKLQMLKSINQFYKIFFTTLQEILYGEQSQWILWIPVALAIGIGLYFSLSFEPSFWISLPIFLMSLFCFFFFKKIDFVRGIFLVFTLISAGFLLAQFRTVLLDTELLQFPIKSTWYVGEIKKVEPRPNDVRLTLKNVKALDENKRKYPSHIRVTWRGKQNKKVALYPGQTIKIKAVLLPPNKPVLPDGYDFRRRAYFEGIQAVGYMTASPEEIPNQSLNENLFDRYSKDLANFRNNLANRLRHDLGGIAGEIATALVTGDRSGISDQIRKAFAYSGIAHLLAISGLHISIIAGLVFLFIRRGLTLIPILALRLPIKKMAAVIAVLLTFSYLLICGATIPAQRAFIMTVILLSAILIDRQALTMRNVAISALFILVIMPESLVTPSFQLSFAAVVVLVSAYEALRNFLTNWYAGSEGILNSLLAYVGGILLTSFLATLATTPYILNTFHHFTVHAISANLVAVPMTSFVVMPLVVIKVLSLPFGELKLLNSVLKQSIEYLVLWAEFVSQWPGSLIYVPKPTFGSIMGVTFSGLWFCIWKTKWRFYGAVGFVLSFISMFYADEPDIFIDETAELIGIYGSNKQAYVNIKRRAKFARESWLQVIGIPEAQKIENAPESVQVKNIDSTISYIKNLWMINMFPVSAKLSWGERKKLKNKVICSLYLENQVIDEIKFNQILKNGGCFIWLKQDEHKIIYVSDLRGKRPWQ